ncbi:glycosyltransferase involved in cell wall biosynthesis [Marmoricola sp. OAE513]|uniref:glycosyltransferase n=1 Tax=Marmoricola sp. OAE513 TaxID=2817894 RepID=UPI001AE979C5
MAKPDPGRVVRFFPDYSNGNPYQAMLHADLGRVGARAVPVKNLLRFLRRRAADKGAPGILHLHWTVPLLQGIEGPFRTRLVLDRFTVALDGFLAAGGRLVWTVHNVLPHDARHRWAEIELARLLVDRAHQVQVLSPATFEAVTEYYELDPARTEVVEHSSYLGVYPDTITRNEARERLGLAEDDRVLVALGGIRPYKGLDGLLDVFGVLAEQDPKLRLLVAGRPLREEEVADLRKRCEDDPRVVSAFEQVPDDELQVWMNAADLAVLPYRDILNSGAFLLAQTFGLPVVAPRAGALQAWEAEAHVWLFEPQDPASLADAVTTALSAVLEEPERYRGSARASAARRSPQSMAAAYAAAIEPLLSR